MLIALGALVVGLIVLTWSADKFIDGAAAVAQLFGMSPLLVGILIIGFGCSESRAFFAYHLLQITEKCFFISKS